MMVDSGEESKEYITDDVIRKIEKVRKCSNCKSSFRSIGNCVKGQL